MIMRAVLDGLGPALLADWTIAEDLRTGRLVDLFPYHDVAATSFETAAWLLYPSRAHLPFKTRATIGFLRQRLTAPH
jgi:DNA-binding transcriptional LysR family regulator